MSNIALYIGGTQYRNGKGYECLLNIGDTKGMELVADYSSRQGTENCAEKYYIIKITADRTIFCLVRQSNGLISVDGVEQNVMLKIAIALPKHCRLSERSPFDLLKNLYTEFTTRCMTSESVSGKEYLKYNDCSISQNFTEDFRQILNQYGVSENVCPHRPMQGRERAYCNLSDGETSLLMTDVQYSELANYSELLVGDQISEQAGKLVTLAIPRPISISIIHDGNKESRLLTSFEEKIRLLGREMQGYERGIIEFSVNDIINKNTNVLNSAEAIRYDAISESVVIDNIKPGKTKVTKIKIKYGNGWPYRATAVFKYDGTEKKLSNDNCLEFEGGYDIRRLKVYVTTTVDNEAQFSPLINGVLTLNLKSAEQQSPVLTGKHNGNDGDEDDKKKMNVDIFIYALIGLLLFMLGFGGGWFVKGHYFCPNEATVLPTDTVINTNDKGQTDCQQYIQQVNQLQEEVTGLKNQINAKKEEITSKNTQIEKLRAENGNLQQKLQQCKTENGQM